MNAILPAAAWRCSIRFPAELENRRHALRLSYFLPKGHQLFGAADWSSASLPFSRHLQRWSLGTLPSTCSTWAPQPAKVGLPQVEQVTRWHMLNLSIVQQVEAPDTD